MVSHGLGMGGQNPWLALMIGNSRLHWAYFKGNILVETGHMGHRTDLPGISDLAEIRYAVRLGRSPFDISFRGSEPN